MTKKYRYPRFSNRTCDPCYDPCYDPCCDPCDVPYKRRERCYDPCRVKDRCYDPCAPCAPCAIPYCDPWRSAWCNPCCVPFPPCPPVLTNLVATGTGPNASSATFALSFTVRNASQITAANVQAVVNIPITSGFTLPTAVGVTQGATNQTSTSVLWSVGTLLPGQSAVITLTFNRPNVRSTGLFTFTVSTSTPESNYNDNMASINLTMDPPFVL